MTQPHVETRASDYSGPRTAPPRYRPHDLVYLDAGALPADTPAWAHAAIVAGQPAVVRRAARDGRTLPVGIRGPTRAQRHALRIALASTEDPIPPESLVLAVPRKRADAIPALAALEALRDAMDGWAGAWGIGGAVGYELATGVVATHADSDIDLIIRTPERPARTDLVALAQRLDALPVRCDLQIETPGGGVALADWLGTAAQVLIKSDQGPYLAADPWCICRPAPRARASSAV